MHILANGHTGDAKWPFSIWKEFQCTHERAATVHIWMLDNFIMLHRSHRRRQNTSIGHLDVSCGQKKEMWKKLKRNVSIGYRNRYILHYLLGSTSLPLQVAMTIAEKNVAIEFKFGIFCDLSLLNSNRRIRSVFRFNATKMSHTQNEWERKSSSVRELEWRKNSYSPCCHAASCPAIAFEWIRYVGRSLVCVSLFKRFRFSPQNAVSASVLPFGVFRDTKCVAPGKHDSAKFCTQA